MKIRWKLLLVMLSISLVPMIFMLWYGQRGMRNLGDELATRTRDTLIQRAHMELKVLVEDHAQILQRERDLIELALKVQASEIEKRVSGARGTDFEFETGHDSMSRSNRKAFQRSTRHFRVMGRRRRIMPLFISYEEQSYLRSNVSPEGGLINSKRLSSMVPVYHELVKKHPQLIVWQITAFENGTQTVYPAVQHYPRWYDALKTEWYQQAKEKNAMILSMPNIDPFTRQFVFIVSSPLLEANGKFIGATAIVVPVGAILKEDEHIQSLSENVTSLLVRSEYSDGLGKTGIRVVAHEHESGQRHHHWWAAQSDEWLVVDNKKAVEQLILDLPKRRAGVIDMSYQGSESLAAYGGIDEFGTALMLIVKKEDIVAEAANMERYVLDRIDSHIHITAIILAVIFVIVICLALFLSRSVTSNIRKLLKASRLIASGDFKTRVRIESSDEMGELGRTFDRMVPELEERIQMKQTLDVAMQVQQNLLPQKMPEFDGLDIAAKSMYCDETGGDFYDFMDFCYRDPGITGVVVGDVSGHGIPAALLMATSRAFLRCRVTQPGDIAGIITDVNQLIVRDVSATGQFLTLFYMEIDVREKKIEWIRAGHDPAIIYTPDIDEFEELRGHGLLMGVEDDIEYNHNTRDVTTGQTILVGTDGIWETRNSSGEMFGKDRLKAIIRKEQQSSAEDILAAILQELNLFRGSGKQEDDVTMVPKLSDFFH